MKCLLARAFGLAAFFLSFPLAVLSMPAQASTADPPMLPPDMTARFENPDLPQNVSPPPDSAMRQAMSDARLRQASDQAAPSFQQAVFSSGVQAYYNGDFKLSALTLARAREILPILADYASYFTGLSLLRDNDPAGAAAEFERAADSGRDSVASRDAMLMAGMCREYLGDPARALPWYERWLADPDQALRPMVLYRAASAASATDAIDRAVAWLKELSVTHAASPWSDKGDVLAHTLLASGRSAWRPFSPENLFAKTRILLDARNPDLVLTLLDFCQTLYPGEQQAGILYYRAKAHAARKETTRAVALFREEVERYPDSDFAPWALYHAIRLSLRQHGENDDPVRSEEAFKEVLRKYPDTVDVGRAIRKTLIQTYLEAARFDDALRLADAQVASVGRGGRDESTEHGAWMRALLLFAKGDFAAARSAFDAFSADYPDSDSAPGAYYWLGRSWLAMGDNERAAASFSVVALDRPNTYYGFKSAELLAKARAATGPTPSMRAPVTSARLSTATPDYPCPGVGDMPELESFGQQTEAYERVRILEACNMADLAERELAHMSARNPGNAALAYRYATLLAGKGEIAAAAKVVQRTFQGCLMRGGTEQLKPFRSLLYPRKHEATVQRLAAGSGIDPNLVFALIRQESFFRDDAVSPAGALGLMQVMPATGRIIAKSLNDKSFTAERLLEPGTNIRYGIFYLNERLRQFGHNVVHTLCGYNAGETRIKRWKVLYAGLDEDLFVEFIPFKETRDYVKRIMTNMVMYNKAYSPTPQPSAS